MTWMMKSCFAILTILFLWQVEEAAEACSCVPPHPQQELCNSDVVIRARVTKRQENDHDAIESVKYNIKVTKVFKGPSWHIDAVYTPLSSAACGVFLNTGKPYLITGRLGADGKVHIILCSFIKPWDALSAAQLSLVQDYKHYCD